MKLVVTKNKQVIQTLELDPEIDFPQIFLLGRSPHCHINLQDSNLSREHGKFILEDKVLYYQEQNQTQRIKMSHAQSIVAGNAKIELVNPASKVSNPMEEKVNHYKPQEEIKLEQIKPEEVKLEDNNKVEELNFNEVHDFASEQQLSEAMLEETFKLNESTAPQDNFTQNSNNQDFNKEPMAEEPAFNFELATSGSEAKEVVLDDDATRVINDFINYQLVLSGPNIPFAKYNINNAETLVGRNNKCDIVLNDTEISSQHAKFILKNNILSIEDLKSVNGVVVNGERVNSQKLVEGDVVVICSVSFLVKINSEFINAEKNILMPVDTLEDSDKTQEFSLGDMAQDDIGREQTTSAASAKANPFQELLNKLPLGELKNNPKRLAIYVFMFFALIMILFVEDTEENSGQAVATKVQEKTPNAEGSESVVKESETGTKVKSENKPVETKSQDEINYLNSHYALAMSYIERGDYVSAISEIDLILKVDPAYKDVSSLHGIAKDGLAKIEEQERKRIEEQERLARKKEVYDLIIKIEEAMKEKNLNSAEVYISQVMAIDPENIKVSTMKIEIDAIREDIRKRAEEEALKIELRKKMVNALAPGKSFFLQKEWYKATIKLTDFLSSQGMDEDLILEASNMLKVANENLVSEITAPLESARQYKNAQDLKNAYEQYSEVLRLNPSHEESLVAAREIKEVLTNRARVIYREALISESISQFSKAKDKFQEVLLIAPSDSEYYKKAEDKLKKIYLE